MIRLEKISKSFRHGSSPSQQIIAELNLQIKEQEHVMIVGANGSGKTTLLNLLTGSVFPDAGNIYLNNENVTHLPEYKRSRFIARLFQNPLAGTSPELSILDNMRLAALRTGTRGLHIGTGKLFRDKVQQELVHLGLGLENQLSKPVGMLSGGQRQALTLIMAVMSPCRILLLDEPTAALDPRTAAMVTHIADDLIIKHKLTAVHITHQMKDAVNHGNRLLMLDGGKVVKDISGEEKQSLKSEDLYKWFE